jgi:SAM-dependent methyltransferase
LRYSGPLMAVNPLRSLWRVFKDWRIGRLASRRYLLATVIPSLAAAGCKRMLFIGTRSYNRPAYDLCAAKGIEVWSVDLDPAAAAHGAPAGHFVGDVRDIDTLAGGLKFDVIVYNGVLGWGVNTAADSARALEALARVAAPGALLFVGWNPGRTDGADVAVIRDRLKRATAGEIPEVIEFPPKGGAQRYPHRYELFRFD